MANPVAYPPLHLNAFIGCSKASYADESTYPAETEIPSPPLLAHTQEKVDALFTREIQALLPFNPSMTKEEMQERYMLLQDEKWRECIDGRDASHGKFTYDMGLHRGKTGDVEPGYIASMEKAMEFICKNITEPLTPEFYLKIHSIACAHFAREDADDFTICKPEEIGRFRTRQVGTILTGAEPVTEDALQELQALDECVGAAFVKVVNSRLAELINRECKRENEMLERFSKVLNAYHRDIGKAVSASQKLYVIGRFFRHCQWLHTTTDGSGRLDIAVLNMLLVQNGLHPVIMDNPYLCSTQSFSDWMETLQKGLHYWQIVAITKHRSLNAGRSDV